MTDSLTRRLEGGITIRRAASVADYRACQDAQREAWGITESGYLVPIATLVGANLHGGLVLGAFRDDGKAVGLSFGFLGRVEDRLCLYSQLTGVIPGWQGQGLGYELKQVQRTFAREASIPVIAWAFDPLQSGNAHFNLVRLGARVRRYIDDMYGPRTDALNAGVPTDRVIAEWEVAGLELPSRAGDPHSLSDLPRLIHLRTDEGEPPIPRDIDDRPMADRVLVDIPDRIADLRRHRPDAAEAWRAAVRHGLRSCFDAGYVAIGLVRQESPQGPRCAYLLQRERSRGSHSGSL